MVAHSGDQAIFSKESALSQLTLFVDTVPKEVADYQETVTTNNEELKNFFEAINFLKVIRKNEPNNKEKIKYVLAKIVEFEKQVFNQLNREDKLVLIKKLIKNKIQKFVVKLLKNKIQQQETKLTKFLQKLQQKELQQAIN